jgi:hypothetical protein
MNAFEFPPEFRTRDIATNGTSENASPHDNPGVDRKADRPALRLIPGVLVNPSLDAIPLPR